MCEKYGCLLTLRMQWAFSRDYYRKLSAKFRRLQQVFFLLLDGFSWFTNMLRFGNFFGCSYGEDRDFRTMY